jgi:hypothetical protein
MNQDKAQETFEVLKEIRDGQREIIAILAAQRTLSEAQLQKSQERIDESVGFQKEALRRQRSITLIVVPAILVCVTAIAYLVFKYF